MTREEIIGVLGILKSAYPSHFKDISRQDVKNTINLWMSMFGEKDHLVVSYAVKQHIATRVYPPSIAEIREVIAEAMLGDGMNSMKAWEEVREAIRFFGYMRGEEALACMHPMTARIVSHIGWMDLCRSEDTFTDRDHFMNLFDEERRKTKEMMMNP